MMDGDTLPWHRLAEMPISHQIPPRRIEFLAFPDVQLLDVTGPLQVFATANRLIGESRYEPRVVSAVAGLVTSSSGLAFLTEALPPPADPLDTLVIAGGAGVDTARRDPALLDWIIARSKSARRIASVCSGAFLLASTGLLDGRRATTHWSLCADLASEFPSVQVETDSIHVADGAVWTSAGVTAGIDMALALLETDIGRTVATAVARHLVVFARRPGGQAQFGSGLALAGTDATFDDLHDWLARNLRGRLTVPILAEQAGMSERSFLRRYREVTGTTPARAVERVRVEAARQALGATSLPVKRIARDCGFGSEATMRRSFMRILAVPPQAYRERFPV